MLIPGTLSQSLKDFIATLNAVRVEDRDKAIQQFCDIHEKLVYSAIKSMTITILPGQIQVVGTGAASNPLPIILNSVVT